MLYFLGSENTFLCEDKMAINTEMLVNIPKYTEKEKGHRIKCTVPNTEHTKFHIRMCSRYPENITLNVSFKIHNKNSSWSLFDVHNKKRRKKAS